MNAIAVATGYTNERGANQRYTPLAIRRQRPPSAPLAGTYTTIQTVTISDSTPSSTIYYTTNGTTPTTSSSIYSECDYRFRDRRQSMR